MSSLEDASTTILVVEDGDQVRRMVRMMLEQNGYRVLEACDGQAAQAILQDHPEVRLVVTDIIMPNIGGAELAELNPRLPFLFISGFTEDPVVTKLAVGSCDFLAKPFTSQVLHTKIQELLRRS